VARPAPDPERVVEVYELVAFRGWSYRRVVEWSKDQPGGKISVGTVSEWVKQGAQWWTETDRLSREAEYGLQRQMLGKFMEWLDDAVEGGDMTTAEAIPLGLKILDRHAKLTGVDAPTRLRVDDDRPAIPAPRPEAVRAIESLRGRVQSREREVIEGGRADEPA
jgi:hypothetical protein